MMIKLPYKVCQDRAKGSELEQKLIPFPLFSRNAADAKNNKLGTPKKWVGHRIHITCKEWMR